ncbi:MAG: SIS domain-containing protein [Deltaproteobacteria bacterium]|nr:SIS domain-containing protein [Deltaproteobacteria bacterium]MBW2121310.1 SIS domain-containing protein [Deltaproteobacteria bacterium]
MATPRRVTESEEYTFTDLEKHFTETLCVRDYGARYLSYLADLMVRVDLQAVENITDVLVEAGERGNTIYSIGNGGSAATASHFVNDITIGTRTRGSKPIRAYSLADNLPALTALANDEGYPSVFVRQLEGLLQPGDVVIAFSVSGNSRNILEALRYAKQHLAITIGLTGFDGGRMLEIADMTLHIPTRPGEYGPAEDLFTVLTHLICSYIRLDREAALRPLQSEQRH